MKAVGKWGHYTSAFRSFVVACLTVIHYDMVCRVFGLLMTQTGGVIGQIWRTTVTTIVYPAGPFEKIIHRFFIGKIMRNREKVELNFYFSVCSHWFFHTDVINQQDYYARFTFAFYLVVLSILWISEFSVWVGYQSLMVVSLSSNFYHARRILERVFSFKNVQFIEGLSLLDSEIFDDLEVTFFFLRTWFFISNWRWDIDN